MTNYFKLVEMFGVATAESPKVDPIILNKQALKRGYIVPPCICNKDTQDFISSLTLNPNSTFYKDWDDIVSKNRLELFMDQVMHYSSTYGSDFTQEGNGYVPNEGAENVPNLTKYKVILPCTPKEMFKKCMDMVCSGIAINTTNVIVLCDYIYDHRNFGIDLDKIKNKEAVAILCNKLQQYPNDKFALLRCIVYTTIQESTIIQNDNTIFKIKTSYTPFDFSKLNNQQLVNLSSIFLRYKNIFLAFKHNSNINNTPIINKLRRMAVKNHTPMKVGLWERVLNDETAWLEAKERVNELTNFKLVTLMQALNENFLKWDEQRRNIPNKSMYVIRNGKVFVKDSYMSTPSDSKLIYWSKLYSLFRDTLVNNLKSKATIVKFPEDYVLNCPASEKTFVGNLPLGTHYKMDKSNYFGIYWRNEWGTKDFDLSFQNPEGIKIGWDSAYKAEDNDVIFSGDMTNAKPEATEVLYCKNTMPDGVIMVNRYNGEQDSTFKLFFGSDNIKKASFNKGYMVNPNSIKMSTMVTSQNREQMVGIVMSGFAFLVNFQTGNSRVSYTKADLFKIFARKVKTFIDLEPILLDAGFIRWKEGMMDENGNPIMSKLDLTDLKKDTLISLFSKE